ncbi:MAG: VanZ family protein [Candidatus Omnitrophica bacterium]|nr:VanZ family protein [Candidatus Omnitrophota bacterium]MCB9747369.1 VanZ family protein [Candidatus Omnitrophota bacterium]
MSSLVKVKVPLSDWNFDKIYHFIEYMPFGFLVYRAIYCTKVNPNGKQILTLSLLISFCYGLSDEIHQYFVPGRTCSGIDLLADTIGGFIGAFIYFYWNKSVSY